MPLPPGLKRKRLRSANCDLRKAAVKEYREMYIPRSDIKFSDGNNNNKWITIPSLSLFPSVRWSMLYWICKDATPRNFYVGNITTEGFDIGINYAPALKGACGIRLGLLINRQEKGRLNTGDLNRRFKNQWDGDVAVRQHRYASQAVRACIDF